MKMPIVHLPVFAAVALLAGCATAAHPSSGSPDDMPTTSGLNLVSSVMVTEHRGQDDLLTGGLGLDGLRAMTPPGFADPAAPTPTELRRRAIWGNWRGIADLAPGGGSGELFGSAQGAATAIAPSTPREPDAGATTMQRAAWSKLSGTCTSTRCGWLAPMTLANAWYSRPGTAATLPYNSP